MFRQLAVLFIQSEIFQQKVSVLISNAWLWSKFSVDYQNHVRILFAGACNNGFQKMKWKNTQWKRYAQLVIYEGINGCLKIKVIWKMKMPISKRKRVNSICIMTETFLLFCHLKNCLMFQVIGWMSSLQTKMWELAKEVWAQIQEDRVEVAFLQISNQFKLKRL